MEQHNGCKDVYENCKHYKVSKYCNRFLVFTTIFTILVVFAIILMHMDFSHSQQKIIETHNEHLSKTEACFTSIYNNLKNEPINCDSLIIALESDKDLAKKITNYNSVKKLIVELANNMSYRSMADELKKDSLLINKQLANSQHATNELLELNFNRIQHEYTVLALWAGVLMIVFLIFSFYSLYKTDDIAKQGKESLKEIVEKGDDVLSGLREQQVGLLDQAQTTLAEINKKAEESQNQMMTQEETFKGRIQMMEVSAERLQQLFSNMFETHTNNNTLAETFKGRIDELEASAERLDHLFSEMTDKHSKNDTLAETFQGRIDKLEATAERLQQLFSKIENRQTQRRRSSKKNN